MHLQRFPINFFLRVRGTLTTLYRTSLFECLLSLYCYTMHVPTLCSIFPDGSIQLEPYTQALFLTLKSLHFSSAWAWAKPMSLSRTM